MPLTDEELIKRRHALLREESKEKERWWWLSFAAEDGFRGALLIKAPGFITACSEARLRGLNPGGEVQGIDCEDLDFSPAVTYRLLNRAEAEAIVPLAQVSTERHE